MLNYIAIIHKSDTSDYGVSFPDFAGCIIAGSTLDEAKDMAHEALQFHVEGMIEDGEELPLPSKLENVLDETSVAYFLVGVKARKPHAVRINATIDSELLAVRIPRVVYRFGLAKKNSVSFS